MEQQMIQVEINGQMKEYPYGITFGEIVKDYQKEDEDTIILVMKDGRLRELHKKLKRDGKLVFITTRDSVGHKTYTRSAVFLLLKAIYQVTGAENLKKVVLRFAIGDGLYFTVEGDVTLDEAFLLKVKQYMQGLVEQKLPIMKRSVGTDDAKERFHRYGMYDKEKLFRYRRVSRVNLYNIGQFEDYFYGYMAEHTGFIQYFDLFLYDEGFVLQLPTAAEPKKVPPFRVEPKLFAVQKEAEEWAKMMQVETVGDLNDRITHGGGKDLILLAEALQEGKISRIAEQIQQRGNVKFVMVAGPSSSGKTTFSQRLSVQLAVHGMKPHLISVDNYFVNREDTPLDEFGNKDYECLEAIDVKGFNQDMARLLAGERVELPEFNFKTGKREYKGNYLQLGAEDVLVIEGIHCLNDKLTESLPKESKFKVYISALTQLNVDEHNRIPTTDGRLIRRMVRDARTRGTSAKETIAMWPSVRRGEEKNIFPYQGEADVMFNSALLYELSALKQYAEQALFGIDPSEPEFVEAKRLLKFLDYFVGIPSEDIPNNSILREFVGGGCFRL